MTSEPQPSAPSPGRNVKRTVWHVGADNSRAVTWFRHSLWLLPVLLLLTLAARPAYRTLKRQRAFAALADAQELAGQHRELEAGRRFKVALDLAPQEPQILRATAQFATRSGVGRSLHYWQSLLATGAASEADRLAYVEEALKYNRLDLAIEQLRLLEKSHPNDTDIQHLKIRFLRQRNDTTAARELAETLLRNHPSDDRTQLTLGTLLQAEANLADRRKGRRLLWALAVGHGAYQDDAIDALVPDPETSRAENELLLKSLRASTNLTTRSRLQIADLRLRLEPTQREAVGAELTTAPAPAAEDQLLVGGWLGRHELYALALDYIPPHAARTNSLLLGIRLEALAALDRWPELEQVITSETGTLDTSIASLFRGELAARDGQRDQAEAQFRAAIAGCTNRVDQLFIIARRAERAGFAQIGIDAMMRLMALPRFTVPAARETLRLLQPLDNFPARKRVIERLAEYLPGDPAVATELAYSKLVLSEDVDRTRERLQDLHTRYAEETEVRLALAFAHLRARKPDEALSLIETGGWDWTTASPRWQAVYAAILAENQERGAARDVALKVDQRRLKSEERNLLRGLL